MWKNLVSDIQNSHSFFDKDPLGATVLTLVALGFLFFYFYFIICNKVLPGRFGGIPIESVQLRVTILGVILFLLLSTVFPKSTLLKLIIVIPIMVFAWFFEKLTDDDDNDV